MKFSRRSRHVGALLALLCMLFMQLAVAGYACTMPAGATAPSPVAMAPMMVDGHAMPDCDRMRSQMVPSLCHANAHAQQQSLDKHEVPPVPSFVAAALVLVFDDTALPDLTPTSAPFAALLARATAPPLAIRNCCLRL